VSNAHVGSASRRNARHSRRAGLCSFGASRRHGRSWAWRFRRTRQAIDSSLRLIETSCRVVEAAERYAARHPLRAGRQYKRVAEWIGEITVQLSSAARTLKAGVDELGRTTGDAGNVPEVLTRATARWVDAVGKLTTLSSRLDDTFDLICEAIGSGTTLDLSALFTRPSGIAPRVIRLRPVPLLRLSRGSGCNRVIQRRRRAARLTYADAVRRIVRGRAPPLVSPCPL
jgi:hypothetical protein